MLETWTCLRCGASWERLRQPGRKPKYCKGCWPKRTKPRPQLPPRNLECRHCGKSFLHPRIRTRIPYYCARDCRIKAEQERKRTDGRLAMQRAKAKSRYVPVRYDRTCAWCGGNFQTSQRGAKYCSLRCSHRAFYQKCKADGRAARMVAARRAEYTCINCGQTAVGFGSKYCSNLCQAEYEYGPERRDRPHYRYISPADRLAVYERDNWTCRICGDPVNRAATFPEPDCAVVDHRIALARMGVHDASNWQTAHNYCNGVKGARELSLLPTQLAA